MRVREVCWRGVRTQACLCGSGCARIIGRATNLVLSDSIPQVAPPLLLSARPGYILSNPSSMPDDGSPGHSFVLFRVSRVVLCICAWWAGLWSWGSDTSDGIQSPTADEEIHSPCELVRGCTRACLRARTSAQSALVRGCILEQCLSPACV